MHVLEGRDASLRSAESNTSFLWQVWLVILMIGTLLGSIVQVEKSFQDTEFGSLQLSDNC